MRRRVVVEKTHLIMQVPVIYPHSSSVEYIDRIACGKNPDTVDSTQRLNRVDCETCMAYINKRRGITTDGQENR